MMISDSALRGFSFVGSGIAMSLLSIVFVVRVKQHRLSPGEMLTRGGVFFLLFSVLWGTGETLWHWWHFRLWFLAWGIFWTVLGLVISVWELNVDRRHSSGPPSS